MNIKYKAEEISFLFCCIAWHVWQPLDDALVAKIEETEAYVRNELSDARSFSLDSPASRTPRLEALRELQNVQAG